MKKLSICFCILALLLGVALGTLCGMSYRTIDYIFYISKNILNRKPVLFVRTVLIHVLGSLIGVLIVSNVTFFDVDNYFAWVVFAGICFLVVSTLTIISNLILNRKMLFTVAKKIKSLTSNLFKR